MTQVLSREEGHALLTKPKRKNKFNAHGHRDADGIWWDSDREEKRWHELKTLQRDGEIINLRRQVEFELRVSGVKVADLRADFYYQDAATKVWTVEDAKGKRTALYKLKKRIFEAQYLVPIIEV